MTMYTPTEQDKAEARKEAEAKYPDRTLPHNSWSGKNQQLHFSNERNSYVDGKWCIPFKSLRPATSEEVLAYKEGLERIKWEGKTRLEEDDACEVTQAQRVAIEDICRGAGIKSQSFGEKAVRFQDGAIVDTNKSAWIGGKLQWLPYEVFLRCLENEVKARKEAEEAQ